MELYGLNQSIECDSAHIIAKKIEVSPPLNHIVFGKCLKYICSRDGEAIITKELNPKISKLTHPIANLNIGDKIIANKFYVLLKGFKARRLVKTHFSGAHNARHFETEDYTFAEISKPYPVGNNVNVLLPENYVSPFKELSKNG